MVKQYDVYRLKLVSGLQIEYIIVLQSGDFSALRTVIAAPIAKLETNDRIARLHVPITLDGSDWIILTPEMAAFPIHLLKSHVLNASDIPTDIMSAVDLLFAGF